MNQTVLIVDRDDLIQKMFCKALRVYGFTPLAVDGTNLDPSDLGDRAPSMAIVEICLNDGTGVELLRRMHAEHPTMRIIALVTMNPCREPSAAPLNRETILRSGASAVLEKPVSLEELKQCIMMCNQAG